ncbi:MAG: DUF6529 family protein [Nocardioides sp.]
MPSATPPTTSEPSSSAVPLAAVTAGALVALLVGVFGKAHDPTLDGTTSLGFETVLGMKVAMSVVIGVLCVVQILSALWIYGKLGRPAPAWLGKAHRVSGILALALSLFVGYHCLWALGLESGTLPDGYVVPLRAVVHGVIGCAMTGALITKVVAVRSRRGPGWFLPAAGGLLFALLIGAVLTSAAWYLGTKGWPA